MWATYSERRSHWTGAHCVHKRNLACECVSRYFAIVSIALLTPDASFVTFSFVSASASC
jgi:hypothetical protein